MIVFPSMLIGPATKAGMNVPDLTKTERWDEDKFPHFTVFCNIQLCRPMKMDGEQWRNAKKIANIPDDRIKEITLAELLALDIEWQK